MLTTVNGAMLTLGISLGHRAGLYDAMAELGAVTSRQLADEAGLQERYVREWLAGQLAGGIVEHDPSTETWLLPQPHALSLTRSAGANNVAFMATGLSRFRRARGRRARRLPRRRRCSLVANGAAAGMAIRAELRATTITPSTLSSGSRPGCLGACATESTCWTSAAAMVMQR